MNGRLTFVELFDLQLQDTVITLPLLRRTSCSYEYISATPFACPGRSFGMAVSGLDDLLLPFKRLFFVQCSNTEIRKCILEWVFVRWSIALRSFLVYSKREPSRRASRPVLRTVLYLFRNNNHNSSGSSSIGYDQRRFHICHGYYQTDTGHSFSNGARIYWLTMIVL
jgi:hypothetical protein